jgi:hypothetical protein
MNQSPDSLAGLESLSQAFGCFQQKSSALFRSSDAIRNCWFDAQDFFGLVVAVTKPSHHFVDSQAVFVFDVPRHWIQMCEILDRVEVLIFCGQMECSTAISRALARINALEWRQALEHIQITTSGGQVEGCLTIRIEDSRIQPFTAEEDFHHLRVTLTGSIMQSSHSRPGEGHARAWIINRFEMDFRVVKIQSHCVGVDFPGGFDQHP